MIIRKIDTRRLNDALAEAHKASSAVDARKDQIDVHYQMLFEKNDSRTTHFKSNRERQSFIAVQQGNDSVVKSLLSGFDRWNRAATAEGVLVISELLRVIIEQNNDIIALLNRNQQG